MTKDIAVDDFDKVVDDLSLDVIEKQQAYTQYMYRLSLLNSAYQAQRNFILNARIDPAMVIVLNHLYETTIKKDKFNLLALDNSIYNNIVINNI